MVKIISNKKTIKINQYYFLKKNTNQNLTINEKGYLFINNFYLSQGNNSYEFKNDNFIINNSTNLEGSFIIAYDICDNCPKHYENNIVIIIHSNQDSFFKVNLKNCIYIDNFDYFLKLTFYDKKINFSKLKFYLSSNVSGQKELERKNNVTYKINESYVKINMIYYILIIEVPETNNNNNISIYNNGNNNNNIIFSFTFKLSNLTVSDYFYVSKAIPFSNASCNLDYLNIQLGEYKLDYKFYDEKENILYYNTSNIKYQSYQLKIENKAIKEIFASNDLEYSKFYLSYNLNELKTNNTIILENNDYYIHNLKYVSLYLKSNETNIINHTLYIENKKIYFYLNKIPRNHVYIIDKIYGEHESKELTDNNIIGYHFYISYPYYLIEDSIRKETQELYLNFKTKKDALSANITMNKSNGDIIRCDILNEIIFCKISLNNKPGKVPIKDINKDDEDYIYVYTYKFEEDSICQTEHKKVVLNVIPNDENKITVYYGNNTLETYSNGTFYLDETKVSEKINVFDFYINDYLVKKIYDVIKFYQKIQVLNKTEISVFKNTSNNIYKISFNDSLEKELNDYEYYLYKEHLYEIAIKVNNIENNTIEFKFDLYDIKEKDKKTLNEENFTNFTYKDKCGQHIHLMNINLLNELGLEFLIDRQYFFGNQNNTIEIIVNGTKSKFANLSLIREDASLEMNMTKFDGNLAYFNYTFSNIKGIFKIKCVSEGKQLILNNPEIYYAGTLNDLIEINNSFSIQNCFYDHINDNNTFFIELKSSIESMTFPKINVNLIDEKNQSYVLNRINNVFSYNINELNRKGNYSLIISEDNKYELRKFNYTYTEVNLSDYYFYDNISFKMSCEPETINFRKDNNSMDCKYDNYKYNCNLNNISFGYYDLELNNKLFKNIFISEYLSELDESDIFISRNSNNFSISSNNYYIPLIQNFSISDDNYTEYNYEDDNFTINLTDLIFYLKVSEEYNYFLTNISDNFKSWNGSFNLTFKKYSFNVSLINDYIDINTPIYNFNLLFHINNKPQLPDNVEKNIKIYKNDNSSDIISNNITIGGEQGIVNCIISINNNTLKANINYTADNKGSNSDRNISINRYTMVIWNCSNEKKRVNLTMFYYSTIPDLYDNEKLIEGKKREKSKDIDYSFLTNKNVENISISNNETGVYSLKLYEGKNYKNNSMNASENSLEIGLIGQSLNLIFENFIYQYEILNDEIFFTDKISDNDFKINNLLFEGNTIKITFDVSKDYDINKIYFFYYKNLCEDTIISNNITMKYSNYTINEVKGTLVLKRDEEELFLSFSQKINPSLYKKTIIKSTQCFNNSKEIICQFDLQKIEEESQTQFYLYNYTYDGKSYDYTHLINVTKDIHCSEGILYTEKKECVLPDEGDFNININEQNSFCREGKGYCQKESNNYICKCKSGYKGLYCEYSNDNATNMQIFQNTIDNFLNYMNESKNISIDKIVLVKEILYLINNTTIVPNEFILLYLKFKTNLPDIISNYYYNKTFDHKYFIYSFDLLLYYINEINKNSGAEQYLKLLNELVIEEFNNFSGTNIKKTSQIINFAYSFHNSKDNYYPLFEGNKEDLNFSKLVIPRNFNIESNKSDIIFINIKTGKREIRKLTTNEKTKIHFLVGSLIDQNTIDRYFDYEKYNINIFKSDTPFFQPCFIQNNKSIPIDFHPQHRKKISSNLKIISNQNKNCNFTHLNKNNESETEIEFECDDYNILKDGLYFTISEDPNNIKGQFLECKISFDIFSKDNIMIIITFIIIILYITFIIIFQCIFNPILIGIRNDDLNQSNIKIPETTEMISVINEEEFDEEENVKVRQTRANFIELKVKDTFSQIFFKNLFQLHPILSTFRPNILSGMVFKFSLFILNILLIGFSNAFFYFESYFEKRINNYMNNSVLVGRFFYPILNETLKIIISSVLPIPFILFINLIILTSYNVRNRLAEAITGTSLDLERKDLAKDFKKKKKIRKIFAYIIIFSLSAFSIGYCTYFCYNYQRTQICFFYSVIWSLIINWFILTPIYIFIVSKLQNKGNEIKVYYLKRLNMFN